MRRKPDIPRLGRTDLGLCIQAIEVFFDLPGFGPSVNQTLESILWAFFLDPFLQSFETSAEDRVLTRERS